MQPWNSCSVKADIMIHSFNLKNLTYILCLCSIEHYLRWLCTFCDTRRLVVLCCNHLKFVTFSIVNTEAFFCAISINLQRTPNHKSLLCLLQKAEDWEGSDHIVCFIWIWLIVYETVFKQLVILLYLPNSWLIVIPLL